MSLGGGIRRARKHGVGDDDMLHDSPHRWGALGTGDASVCSCGQRPDGVVDLEDGPVANAYLASAAATAAPVTAALR